jgi:hypothetical protein
MLLPLFSLFIIKASGIHALCTAAREGSGFNASKVYHFITFAIPEIFSSVHFISNLSCNLNHPCMQHYTMKSDTREWGSGFNASNNFINPSHTPKLSQKSPENL